MALSEAQKDYIQHLGNTLSLEALINLIKGNIEGIKNFNLKLIDPNLIKENVEMKEILAKCIYKRFGFKIS